MKVLKFGGSSVARPERILGIVDILKDYYASGDHFTVVFSAFGGVTDSLIEMSRLAAAGDDRYGEAFQAFADRHQEAITALLPEGALRKETSTKMRKSHDVLKNLLYGIFLVREASPRTMDYVLSFGERSSSYIISQVLQQAGIPAEYLDARKIIRTDKTFGSAKVNFDKSYEQIRDYYAEHSKVQVVTGFVASAKGGLTTTLGRGGSDYTASLIAAGLKADAIEIWTDVSGVLTADPRRVKKAFTIPRLTYAEAMEMSHFGAKVIYPPTLMPALHSRIPLYIKNTFDPSFPGTKVSEESSSEDEAAVRGISSINNVALLTLSGSGLFGVPGISARLFGALAQKSVNIILITQGSSEHAISFAVQPSDSDLAKKAVEEAFAYEIDRGVVNAVKMERDLSVVAIIGENMRYQPGVSGRLFQALGKNGINAVAIAQGSSELNVSVVIPKEDENKALNALHEAFFLSDYKTLHLFIVGVGLIGSTLLEQIRNQNDYLRSKLGMEVKVVGMANSRKMIFDEEGLELDTNWKDQLMTKGDDADLAVFIGRMRDLNLSNSIFVDNTANDKIAGYYAGILDESISISTPNKVANSSSYLQYQRLKSIAAKRGVQFHYETNVGAGLPIISTLQDLLDSGDQIRKIEGVLSGSLSFIFNNFDGTRPFHEIVREAKEKGFTEPDPRIDLSGKDVGRKILILARETGISMETEHIELKGFLPEGAMDAPSVDDFFSVLEENTDYFTKLYASAAEEGKVLRMIATLEGEQASVGVQAVGPDNPFHGLSGSDNMVVFTTDRYNERPLVVRGPGAGAEVTAAGVFAEIIKIGKFLS
ncbi:bifunctional aspartate kinase/homoserine dehydrogenase I [Neolewinella aurantiaca]|uniref:Bifunctional aspartate kinase/homoserine dehydrogenase I n=1 Tax=Neolewinella aurantiaca TaxID=2602767 RepID=A0A5C7FW71_9BACT|nr:bifunctional aspartate kinase/homoserine dehydrogenase I [Neolewinella aurantiaca]TXF90624.1 bifunctional aspartate kinase/homoserine dehydrogenase I [Neolewinella aurantiaca]